MFLHYCVCANSCPPLKIFFYICQHKPAAKCLTMSNLFSSTLQNPNIIKNSPLTCLHQWWNIRLCFLLCFFTGTLKISSPELRIHCVHWPFATACHFSLLCREFLCFSGNSGDGVFLLLTAGTCDSTQVRISLWKKS